MRHTRLVTNIAITLFLVGSFVGTTANGSSTNRTLDLTKVPPSERRSMGVPGGSIGGVAGGQAVAPQRYQLPVMLEMKSLRRLDRSPRGILTVEITNDSKETLKIPSCVNPHTAFPADARERRLLNFGIRFDYPSANNPFSDFVEVTSASELVPKCSAILNPGDRLTVIMNTNLPQRTSAEDKDLPTARAFLEEWKLSDSGYVIEKTSNRVESGNALPLP